MAASLGAQSLSDRFKENSRIWEMTLDRGDGAAIRRSTDALLHKEGLAVSHSDYNEMRALMAVNQVAARACVLDGAWEDSIAALKKASEVAAENLVNSTQSLTKLRKEHEQYLAEWRDVLAKQEPRLKELNQQLDERGLTQDLSKQREQLRAFIEERRNAITHSEQSLREIDSILARLKEDQDSSAKSLAAWGDFLAKEKQDIAQAASPQKYVGDKLAQVKADEARPRFDRLAYTRRLLRLDPDNAEAQAFVKVLLGGEEAAPAPLPKPNSKKGRKKR
ncbi:MAG TPA: hypothetical protein PKL14_02935 [Holophaga sp.]|nr:hypothetical protein [Holophaga sp.]